MDGGSFLTPREFAREMVDRTSLQAMVKTGCVASTVGEFDLRMGADYLKARVAETGLPLVSANVYDEATGELLGKPYVIVERGGVKFGITGVMSPALTVRVNKDVTSAGATVGDPLEALNRLVPEIRKQADFVILLSHMGLDRSKELVQSVKGIDFLVVGNHSTYSARSFEEGTTAFLQPGYKGQYMSVYRLKFDQNGVYQGYTGETLALDDKAPADASVALLIKEHKLAVEQLNKERAAQQAQSRATQSAAPAAYSEACIGVNGSCRRCHKTEHDQWLVTAHAKAFETLDNAHQSTNPACVRCHTTCQLDLKQDGSEQVVAELRGVQCEACHGIGTDHARDGSYGRVSVGTCLSCHDKENSPDFNYAQYLPKVTH